MEHLPKILPGYYRNRGIVPYDRQCCQVYKGPSGKNPIANGYGSASLERPFDYGENCDLQRCGIAPMFKNL